MHIDFKVLDKLQKPLRVITFDGYTHDLEDLYELLSYVADDEHIYVDDYLLGKKLLELKVLSNLGSMHGVHGRATPGENFQAFWEMLQEEYKKSQNVR